MKSIRDSYKIYKKTSQEPIEVKEFAKINNLFNKFIIKQLFDGKTIMLPMRMGAISIKGRKIKIKYDEQGRLKGFAPNYKATRELWEKCPKCKEEKQIVFHLNEHTDMIRYKFFWSKDRMLIENKLFYTMVFTRTNKRNLSKLIQGGREFFVEQKDY